MAWELIETKKNLDAIKEAVADFESQPGVAQVDSISLETYARNRVFVNMTYTEA